MKRVHFFALRDDLIPFLEIVEGAGSLQYVRCGQYQVGNALEVFSSGHEIPNLGRATTYNACTSETFLVSEPQIAITRRPITRTSRFAVDQLWNPDTVTFTPSGVWNEDVVLYGRVATVSDTKLSQKLMRRFHSAAKRCFTKMEEYYVGSNAVVLLRAGKRLTIGAHSPLDCDLRIG
jgi:hypothetical protein